MPNRAAGCDLKIYRVPVPVLRKDNPYSVAQRARLVPETFDPSSRLKDTLTVLLVGLLGTPERKNDGKASHQAWRSSNLSAATLDNATSLQKLIFKSQQI